MEKQNDIAAETDKHRRLQRLCLPDDLTPGSRLEIGGDMAHYLQNVLRAKIGEALRLFNGRDGEFLARIEGLQKKTVILRTSDRLRPQRRGPDIWLLASPIKKAHFEYMIEKATELGVAKIQPILTERTQIREVNEERCRAISREAAEQSERLECPEIAPPMKLTDLVARWPKTRLPIVAAELGQASDATDAMPHFKAHSEAAIFIGPEGGFTAAEFDLMRNLPLALFIRLGPRMLRADTAALAALTLWQTAAGDWSRPS